MDEKGFVSKATQDKGIELLIAFLLAKGVTGIKAKLIVTGVSLLVRLGDDVFAEKVENESLKVSSRKVLEDIVVRGDVDVAELLNLAMELIDAFKKNEA